MPLDLQPKRRWAQPPHLHRREEGSRRGFTLVELLVVIAIISILAGLLLPALSKVRATAYTTQCASRMRQVLFGVQFYLEDYNGVFAGAIQGQSPWAPWSSFILGRRSTTGYVCPIYIEDKSVVNCPSQFPQKHMLDPGGWSYGEAYATFGFLCNWYSGSYCGELIQDLWVGGANNWFALNRIKKPSRVFMIADAVYTRGDYPGFQNYMFHPTLFNYDGGIHLRHARKTNRAYMDGHVSPGDAGDLQADGITAFVDEDMNEIGP